MRNEPRQSLTWLPLVLAAMLSIWLVGRATAEETILLQSEPSPFDAKVVESICKEAKIDCTTSVINPSSDPTGQVAVGQARAALVYGQPNTSGEVTITEIFRFPSAFFAPGGMKLDPASYANLRVGVFSNFWKGRAAKLGFKNISQVYLDQSESLANYDLLIGSADVLQLAKKKLGKGNFVGSVIDDDEFTDRLSIIRRSDDKELGNAIDSVIKQGLFLDVAKTTLDWNDVLQLPRVSCQDCSCDKDQNCKSQCPKCTK